MIPEDFLNWKRITMVNKSKTPFFPISPCKRYPLGIWKIGSLHEISIAFRYTWSESVFHADSHGIFYFFFKSAEMCVFLI
jgi:hypothetical protein